LLEFFVTVVTEYSNNFTKPFEAVSSWMPSALCDSVAQRLFGDCRPR